MKSGVATWRQAQMLGAMVPHALPLAALTIVMTKFHGKSFLCSCSF